MGRSRRQPRIAGPSRKGLRTCIGCRRASPRDDLIRLVRDPSGAVFVDRHLRAPGRGAHLCYDPSCINNALQRRAPSRAFQGPVTLPTLEALLAEIIEGIDARIWARLGIARRSRQALSGADALSRGMGRVGLLILAEDCAENSRKSLQNKANALGCPVVIFGTALTLGESQGAPHRVAIGVLDPLAGVLKQEFERRASLSAAPQE
ncbi:DUF448 domain-containing protein [Myxococcota bacterium]|nr:DUF448 domain-containing protein [Myxococcota bacterium]MBU1433194.1 DUF448 domain-containing protein [Myxococcota bacterium]MBU1900179.1 DUF448 domain-containing protein [Myxococcota bacterium]